MDFYEQQIYKFDEISQRKGTLLPRQSFFIFYEVIYAYNRLVF
jgi:hypothetical protein